VTDLGRPQGDAALLAPEQADVAHLPAMSVIITTPDSYDTIRPLVRALSSQTARASLELVIVAPSADAVRGGIADLQGFGSWRVVELGVLRTVAQAKAAGIRSAAAPIIVLTEDHCFPDPHWAQVLIEAHRGDWSAVGPAMENANPQTAVSWADFILGYGPWLNPPEAAEVDLLPGHNSSYKRDVLLGYGDRLESLLAAETNLQQDLRARGHRLYLDPAAKAFHTNFTEPSRWIPYLFYSGRLFAAERGRDWPRFRRAGYGAGAFLIPLVRFMRLAPPFRRARPDLATGVYGPLLFALIIDAAGQAIGYVMGPGHSAEQVARLEFHREARHRE
jgi:hypothetical protein